MAGITFTWCTGKSCRVALGTNGSSVNAGKRKSRQCMIKIWIQPVVAAVAHQTVKRMLLRFMILRTVILNLMASDAITWRIQYRSLVTRGALGNPAMTTGNFKTGGGVIKCRRLPTGRGMASLALYR